MVCSIFNLDVRLCMFLVRGQINQDVRVGVLGWRAVFAMGCIF